ncbi:MAG: inorganic diphosphatase, partial [Mariprofundus sp.]|nr:inorganic diphosphatase [Mariprofundus sp.]
MDITKIPAGDNPPEDINVVIEVPQHGDPIKYELDKESGAVFVDRFMHTAMHYPCNYGFIPNTLSGDGDPADVLVVSQFPLIPGCVINCRPIGILLMEDEAGMDGKILAVPSEKLKPVNCR